MITDVFFFPNGMVATFAAPVRDRKSNSVIVEPRQVPQLQGSYSRVKFMLIPAINSCQPELHGSAKALHTLDRDMRRFCVLKSKKRKEQEQEENAATESAQAVMAQQ